MTGQPRPSLFVQLLPLLVLQLYLNVTLIAFALGPWEYPLADYGPVVRYVLAAHVALALGYLVRGTGRARGYVGPWTVDRITFWSSLVTLALVFPTSALNTGHVVPDVVFGLMHPAEAYAAYQSERIATTPLAAYVRIFFGPALVLPIPLTVFYWRSLRRSTRIVGVAAIMGNVMLSIAMAVNQGIVIPAILIPVFIGASALAGRIHFSVVQRVTVGVLAMVGLAGGLVFFTAGAAAREGSSAATGVFAQIGSTADRNNLSTRYLSDASAIGVFGLTSYMGQGYYGLALAMSKPFIPMYGIGHSTFLYRQAARITGNERLEHESYPERISDEDGWTAVQFFQTIYPWFASDVGFPGTLVVVFLIGFAYAASWREILLGANPFAVGFFGILTIMLLYFPALNAILQGGEGLTGFWGLALGWALTRRRFFVRPRSLADAR